MVVLRHLEQLVDISTVMESVCVSFVFVSSCRPT